MTKKHLLVQHLEDVSWQVLEVYPQLARDMIRRRAGIYALYRKRKLYYVGLASSLMGRLKTHLKDRHHGLWDRFNVYLTSGGVDIKEIESLLLRIANPSGNRVGGRLSKSENLRSLLNRKMTELDDDRRARLMGGQVAQRRIRHKTRRGTGTLMLAGLFERRTPLRGEYQGTRYRASLRRDGYISYGGKLYKTPQAAASAALGRVMRGWYFWRYRDENGNWVRLRVLKR